MIIVDLYTGAMYSFNSWVFLILLLFDSNMWNILCKNASVITTAFRISRSFMYLSLQPKTCSSGIELTI